MPWVKSRKQAAAAVAYAEPQPVKQPEPAPVAAPAPVVGEPANLLADLLSRPIRFVAAADQPAAPAAAPAVAPAPVAAPAVVVVAAPVAAPSSPNWKDPAAPWRREPATRKQLWKLRHLRDRAAQNGIKVTDDGRPLNRGAASDLIDAIKSALDSVATAAGRGGPVAGCSIGPFRGGRCLECGLPQAARR
jgi:hypothetical protein